MDKEQEKRELLIRMQETDKQFEKNKLKRSFYVMAFYTFVNVCFFYFIDGGFGNVLDFLGTLLASVVVAFIELLVNGTIFFQLFERSRSENETLKRMKERFDKLVEDQE